MKKIPLSVLRSNKNKPDMFALVDDDDYDFLMQWNWSSCLEASGNTSYVRRKITCLINKKRINIHMHRVVMKAKKEQFVDHINGNGLDNRKKNIRFCTPAEKSRNKKTNRFKKLDAIKGVTIVKDRKGIPAYWIARITVDGIRRYLGTFKTKEIAEHEIKKASIKYHGDFSNW